MARVSINDCAHFDLRLTQASRALRIHRERLVYRLLLVWSQVTEASSALMTPQMLALALGRQADQVTETFVDARLATAAGDLLDLEPMRSLFGDYEWYAELPRTASSGGQVRAETATRDDDGQYVARDYAGEVLALLADGDYNRTELRQAMRAKNTAVRAAVRDLLANGSILERDGRLALAERVPSVPDSVPLERVPGTHDSVPFPTTERGTGTHDSVPVPGNASRGTSAPAPVPAHAPARESTHARDRNPTGNAFPGTQSRERGTRNRERVDLTSKVHVSRDQRRAVARELWRYQNRKRHELDPDAPALPFDDTPTGNADAIVLALARYSPAQCKHALDVFAAEGQCLGEDGRDALEYLNGRTNWKPEPLERAVGSTLAAVRKRFKKRKPRTAQAEQPQATTRLG